MLLRYDYKSKVPIGMVGGGRAMAGSAQFPQMLYLLCTRASTVQMPAYNWNDRGKNLREALRPYASHRLDLAAVLDGKQFIEESVVAFVHALNSGQLYIQPTSSPPFGVD